ncbi:hypothetical protein SLEP1_g40940 [Rubroshorea leprosula]|uniref:Reverse transcriptase zinc-binding domain-containing protein n=1 Tax=Rubroshorea leprosula TaxID=152421 RepID=A0AAV5L5D4_9ROSI|nr:hypothetical protein SLEP1_g40940 [Rubroshorea leprosula]
MAIKTNKYSQQELMDNTREYVCVDDDKSLKGQGWRFNWRHEPFGRELDEYKRLEDTLKPVNIHDTKPNNFNWIHCPSRYSAKSAYQILENPTTCLQGSICSLIWNPLVPSKVSFMIWRLFLNRLPTKDNLFLRGVNLTNNPNCMFCGDHPEDANHIFAKCRQSQKLWSKICHWWGFLFVPPDNAFAMLHQLSSLQVPKKARSWNLTISTAAWSIWEDFNQLVCSIKKAIAAGRAVRMGPTTFPFDPLGTETLGFPHPPPSNWASFIWLCSPMSGLLVQGTSATAAPQASPAIVPSLSLIRRKTNG